MAKLYILWYGFSIIAAAVTWHFSYRLTPWLGRFLITGIIALGFTTIPLGRDGEGALFPMGFYYFSRSNWLEAAAGATTIIGIVWALLYILFSAAFVLKHSLRKQKIN